MNLVTDFFGSIFNFINGITGSYGWSIVLFTILFRMVLSPIDIHSRKGQRDYSKKMAAIQPEIELLNKAYKNEPQKLQSKMMELRKREGIGIMPKGCGAMLLTWPILIAFFAVFRNLAGQQMAQLASIAGDSNAVGAWFNENSFLWIKNIWQPDVAFNFQEVWGLRTLWIIKDINGYIIPTGTALETVIKSAFGADWASILEQVKAPLETLATSYTAGNGLYILPILAGVAQWFSLKLTPQTAQPVPGDPQAAQAAKTGNFMKIFFPIMFVYFCMVSSSALAIYWITSSLCMMLLNFIINKVLDKRDAAKQALLGKQEGVK